MNTPLELSTSSAGRWCIGLLEAGSGAPIVFLHGSADTAFAWKPVIAHMAATHRVYALDMGSTSLLEGETGDGRLAADHDLLRSLIDMAAEPVHLVGHSYGALLALRFTLNHPERIRSLCLTEPIAFGLLRSGADRQESEGEVEEVLGGFLKAWNEGQDANAIEIILDYWNGRGSWAAMPGGHRERILAGAERFHGEVSCAYADRTSLEEVRALGLPSLVAHGERTTRAAKKVCALLSATLPDARSLCVDGAGHSPMRSHPEVYASALRQLMGSSVP